MLVAVAAFMAGTFYGDCQIANGRNPESAQKSCSNIATYTFLVSLVDGSCSIPAPVLCQASWNCGETYDIVAIVCTLYVVQ